MSTAAAFTGDIPKIYDSHLGPVLFEYYGQHLAQKLAALHPNHVLKVACGTGIDTRATKTAIPNARVVATDLNPDMLKVAEAKFLPGEVEFKVVDCQELPFPDASFDAVACQFGIMFVPDKDKALQEAMRVLQPGGILVCSVWEGLEANPASNVTEQLIQDTCHTDPPRFLHTPYGFFDRIELKSLFERNGFVNVELEDVKTEVPFDAARFAHGVVFGTPAFAQLNEHPEVELGSFTTELSKRMEEFSKTTGGKAPLHAIFVSGQKSRE